MSLLVKGENRRISSQQAQMLEATGVYERQGKTLVRLAVRRPVDHGLARLFAVEEGSQFLPPAEDYALTFTGITDWDLVNQARKPECWNEL